MPYNNMYEWFPNASFDTNKAQPSLMKQGSLKPAASLYS